MKRSTFLSHKRSTSLLVALCIPLCALTFQACKSNPQPTAEQAAPAPDPRIEVARRALQEIAPLIHTQLTQQTPPLKNKEVITSAISPSLQHAEILKPLYEEDEHTLAWTTRLGLSPTGQAIFDLSIHVDKHGIDPAPYNVQRLRELHTKLTAHTQAVQDHLKTFPSLSDDSIKALASTLSSPTLSNKDAQAALAQHLTSSPSAELPKTFSEWASTHQELLTKEDALLPELDVLLSHNLLLYAHAQRYANPRFHPEELIQTHGEDKVGLLLLGQVLRDLRQLTRNDTSKPLRTGTFKTPQELLASLPPQNPQYTRLVTALARYKEIAAQGGWPTDFPRFERPLWGKKQTIYNAESNARFNPKGLISKVKKRLAAEGYFKGPIDDAWTDELSKAILAFRPNYQLWKDKPRIDYDLLEAMRISADYRVAQIRLSLQKWRESRIGDDPYFVYVNIPDFHGELWDKGTNALRFRVVVGDPSRTRRRRKLINATPLLSSKVDTITFNPSWFVPRRIKMQELDKKLAKNPNWYADNGYEVTNRNGEEYVRQLPGRGNALGKVKIGFPNKHSVYLHDTANKGYFRFPVRAFSHGCMRVKDPLKLAQAILVREDKTWEWPKVNHFVKRSKDGIVRLENGPSVHIDYITVRVDDDNNIQFLTDVYDFDRVRIRKDYGIERKLL